MTYDELIEKLERERKFLQQYIDGDNFTVIHALRAVVDLHNCSNKYCGNCGMASPCFTIQAIDKELP